MFKNLVSRKSFLRFVGKEVVEQVLDFGGQLLALDLPDVVLRVYELLHVVLREENLLPSLALVLHHLLLHLDRGEGVVFEQKSEQNHSHCVHVRLEGAVLLVLHMLLPSHVLSGSGSSLDKSCLMFSHVAANAKICNFKSYREFGRQIFLCRLLRPADQNISFFDVKMGDLFIMDVS